MAVHVLDAMSREGFEQLIAFHDRASGARAFLGIHDTTRGPAFGGIRRFTYRDEKAGLLDCLRLSKAMSMKCALLDLEAGGAKLVLFDHPSMDLAPAYRHLGRRIQELGGRYYAGPDVGTGMEELAWVAEETEYVTRPGDYGPGELPASTASGVFAGMRAGLEHLDGEADWSARTIVVQGIGSVGWMLAERLVGLGARVVATDVDDETIERARASLGIECVESGTELDIVCDVFCPCAMGGVLHDLSIQRLRARMVCGAANNLLARSHHADSLEERGILYVPDFVVNGGAVLRGAGFHLEGRATPLDEIEERIGDIAAKVLRMAKEIRTSPFSAARSVAEDRIRASIDAEAPNGAETKESSKRATAQSAAPGIEST